MINKEKLHAIMQRKGETLHDLAEILGLSYQILVDKINRQNGQSFVFVEVDIIREHYSLSADEANAIFMQLKGGYSDE